MLMSIFFECFLFLYILTLAPDACHAKLQIVCKVPDVQPIRVGGTAQSGSDRFAFLLQQAKKKNADSSVSASGLDECAD